MFGRLLDWLCKDRPVYCDLETAEAFLDDILFRGNSPLVPRGFWYYGIPQLYPVGMRRVRRSYGYKVVAGCRDLTPFESIAHWKWIMDHYPDGFRKYRATMMVNTVLPALEAKAKELGWISDESPSETDGSSLRPDGTRSLPT
jgi:hypothetical protein